MASKRTLQSELRRIFGRVRKRERFESPLASQLLEGLHSAIVSSAIAKCVDLNVLANTSAIAKANSFLLLANLRGVAEDLIVLEYLKTFSPEDANKFLVLRQRQTTHDGMLTQLHFFKANNPFQPVVGGKVETLERLLEKDRGEIRDFWTAVGSPRKNGPTIKDMAASSGLTQTYDYIYFLSSNFVHFNPHTLMRMGWGPETGPFQFSVHNFAAYYADLASFYCAVLFVGFFYRVGSAHFSPHLEADVLKILEAIDDFPRWPEIVTFEEMNLRPPMLPFMAHAMRRAMEGSDEQIPYGAILREVRGLPG